MRGVEGLLNQKLNIYTHLHYLGHPQSSLIWYSKVFKSERVDEVIGDLGKTEDLARQDGCARGVQGC